MIYPTGHRRPQNPLNTLVNALDKCDYFMNSYRYDCDGVFWVGASNKRLFRYRYGTTLVDASVCQETFNVRVNSGKCWFLLIRQNLGLSLTFATACVAGFQSYIQQLPICPGSHLLNCSFWYNPKSSQPWLPMN